jgi:NAD(P)-dependent dehydrogenase (short-subunit alcohol dehydrogenase family)
MSSGSASKYLTQLFGLSGRTSVVIGGTGTLGGSFCEALAAAGSHVVVVGRNAEHGADVVARITAAGGSAAFSSADATRREDLIGLRDRIASSGRCVDVLVNAPGTNSPTPFLDITDEEWDRIMAVNVDSVRYACQVFAPGMLERKSGSIINIASVSAELPLSRVFTYSTSKAAVLSLTRNLAREWAPHGVRVNALSPGFFPAEQNRKVLTPDRIAKVMGHTPMNRFGSPEELAGALLLLASPVAGSFITGCNLLVDGGFTAMTI